jgi:effector-binding domain-containing protein
MEITETTFGPRTYLFVRKAPAISEIANKELYDSAFNKLSEYGRAHNLPPHGPGAVLYFSWNVAENKAEIGIGYPVAEETALEDAELELLAIPQLPAVQGVLRGSYSGLAAAHGELNAYLAAHGLAQGSAPLFAIEEYTAMSVNEAELVTTISYFHA